ncbi:MAG: hypothetical protein L0Y66_00775 [Myxococcaceae bacterium]|nr:hypothetical protein [Myxococcaceae bacterium]MCI0669649.1 hypothetical protein [Myxococcaceae bacterium]
MRSPALLVLVLLSLAVPSAAEPPNPALERAQQHLQALKYREALTELEQALSRPDNERATLLRVLELRGVTAAVLDRLDTANDSFRRLLVLEPSFVLASRHSPRIQSAFAESRAWLETAGPLRFAASTVPARHAVEAQVQADPLSMARRVRFHFLTETGKWRAVGGELEGARVEVDVPSDAAEGWWAELLGDRDGVLARAGSADSLLALPVRTPPPALAAPLPPMPPPPPPVEPSFRWAAYGLWGVAGSAAVAGTVFGLRSRGARETLDTAARDGEGRVVGLTQVQAQSLRSRSHNDARLANVLFGTGAVLALGGVGVWWWGQTLRVAPGPGALVVTGALP